MSCKLIAHNWSYRLFLLISATVIILFSIYNVLKTVTTKYGVGSNPKRNYSNVQSFIFETQWLGFNNRSTKCSVDRHWIQKMHAWTDKNGMYSQGAQDFYLEKIFSVIGPSNKYFIEFGFNSVQYEAGGTGANTRKLYENKWHGLLLDADYENPSINLKKYFLFATNIVAIFTENQVPKEFDYLSCDMDSHDLWVFRAILEAGYRPRVITTEYNANYPITDSITLLDPTIVSTNITSSNSQFKFAGCAWGAGAAAFRIVAEAHGYTMIGRVASLDMIWLRNDLLQRDCYDVPSFDWFFHDALIGKLHHTAQTSSEILTRIIDYETYLITAGNITASNLAARAIIKNVIYLVTKESKRSFDNLIC